MSDNSIGRSFQRIRFWNNFVTEKLNTEQTDCPEVKEEVVEDEQCCIDLNSPWLLCGAVAAGEPLTDPLSLEEDQASGKAVKPEVEEISCRAVAAGEPLTSLKADRERGDAVTAGFAEVSSRALAAVQRLADTLIPQGSRMTNQRQLSTTGSVEQEDSIRADHSPDHDSIRSARVRRVASPAASAFYEQTRDPPGPGGEPDVWPGERAEKRCHTCAACGKEFEKPIHLSLHVRVHEAAGPYSCDSCAWVFQTYVQFLSHSCVRSDEKSYSCSFCERRFRTEQWLTRHVREHGSDRPFPCAVCGLAFRTQFNLDLHVRTHSAGSVGGRGGSRAGRPYACSICGELFNVKAKLTYHERSSCMLGVYAPFQRSHRKASSKLADT